MGVPTGIGVIDTMIGLPAVERRGWYTSMRDVLRDEGSASFEHPAGYMFTDVPTVRREDDSVDQLLHEMDRFGIERGLVPVDLDDPLHVDALARHPDRLSGSIELDPNDVMGSVRALDRAVHDHGIAAAQFFPAGKNPPVPIDDARAYPIYAKCVELDVPVFLQAGVPGPRVPATSQEVARVDVVCYDFPDLRLVLRHGGEPWVDLAVKLLLKWPNLFYSTTAFAPRYFPDALVHFANTRGAGKILYGGYYPWGFELERIFAELDAVPFREHVWPKFLRENALRVLGLPG